MSRATNTRHGNAWRCSELPAAAEGHDVVCRIRQIYLFVFETKTKIGADLELDAAAVNEIRVALGVREALIAVGDPGGRIVEDVAELHVRRRNGANGPLGEPLDEKSVARDVDVEITDLVGLSAAIDITAFDREIRVEGPATE